MIVMSGSQGLREPPYRTLHERVPWLSTKANGVGTVADTPGLKGFDDEPVGGRPELSQAKQAEATLPIVEI